MPSNAQAPTVYMCVGVWVCGCGCVGVWVCGCGCVGVDVCESWYSLLNHYPSETA